MTGSGVIEIGSRRVGGGAPCLVVAEVAQAHDGSLGTAHAYIDAAARAGADAVKFQTHLAAAESTAAEAFRVRFSPQDATRYDYWKRMEFSAEQWLGLARHASETGLLFLSSPFSEEAVDLLQRLGVPAWKVGAGEVSNLPLLDRLAASGKPVLLSSGMSSWEDLDAAVARILEAGSQLAVYQCTSAYPCPPQMLGLNNLALLRERYGCPVGLSDHSGTVWAGLAARVLGADLLEVHVTFSRECFGPDVSASITTAELAELIRGIRYLERALSSPVDKAVVAEELAPLRLLFGRSAVSARSLRAGRHIEEGDIALKKPGGGVPPTRAAALVGRVLRHDIPADHAFEESDFEL